MGSCLQSAGERQSGVPAGNSKAPVAPSGVRRRSVATAGSTSTVRRPKSPRVAAPQANPLPLFPIARGCEVVVWGQAALAGARCRVIAVDTTRGEAELAPGAPVGEGAVDGQQQQQGWAKLWQLLTHRHEAVAYYAPPTATEVRWFVTQGPAGLTLVRWTQGGTAGSARAQAEAVRKVTFSTQTRFLRDERGRGERIDLQDWRRVAVHLAPACERAGVGHNLPIREVRAAWWSAGTAVWAQWGAQWHPGCIASCAADGSCTVVWDEDGTATAGVCPAHLRPWQRLPPRPGGSAGQGTLALPVTGSNGPSKPISPDTPRPSLVSHPGMDFDEVYEQGEKLGEGGFGEVYEVRHKASGRRYAAKVLGVCHGNKDEVREIPGGHFGSISVGSRVQGVSFVDLAPEPPAQRTDKEAQQHRRWLRGRPLSGVVACLLDPGCGPYGADGVFAGVILDVPVGSHQGTVGGTQFFEAPPGRGAFIPVVGLRPVLPQVVELSIPLRHPNLAGLVDWRGGRHAYSADGKPDWDDEVVYGADSENYMVCIFELCSGGALEAHLRRLPASQSPAAAERAAAAVLRSVLRCLAYLHERGVVHHDLKVSNVLLRQPLAEGAEPDALGPDVALCDLGLSKFVGDPHTGGGTLLWMAPELLMAWRWRPDVQWSDEWLKVAELSGINVAMLREGPSYDTKVDCFAAGMLAFYVVSRGRRHPFHLEGHWASLPEQEHLLRLATSITDGPIFSDAVWASVSAECRELIELLLLPNASERPSAATALRHPWLEPARPHRPIAPPRPKVPLAPPTAAPADDPTSLLHRMQALKLRHSAKGAKAPPRAPPRGTAKGLPSVPLAQGSAIRNAQRVPQAAATPQRPKCPVVRQLGPGSAKGSGRHPVPAARLPQLPLPAEISVKGSPAPLRSIIASPATPAAPAPAPVPAAQGPSSTCPAAAAPPSHTPPPAAAALSNGTPAAPVEEEGGCVRVPAASGDSSDGDFFCPAVQDDDGALPTAG